MGLDNAYRMNPKNGTCLWGSAYPNGLPAFYAQGVHLLHLSELTIDRPSPLPPGGIGKPWLNISRYYLLGQSLLCAGLPGQSLLWCYLL
ncbi:hypothetical protein P4S72_23800 [Vibrio sp. PP-XX7]